MITRVRVKNYRSIAEVDVQLGPLTVLVGRNGAGKSAFIDVLRFTRDAVSRGLNYAIMERGGIASLRRWLSRRRLEMEIAIEAASINFWGEYAFAIQSKGESDYLIKSERCRVGTAKDHIAAEYSIRNGHWEVFTISGLPGRINSQAIEPTDLLMSTYRFSEQLNMYSSLAYSHYYAIFPNTLRVPQKSVEETALDDSGENLATILRKIKAGRYFPDLLVALDRIVGGVNDLRVRQVGSYLVTEIEHQFNGKQSCWFDLAQESDGTLRILALLTALYQDPPHGVMHRTLGIEEPELTLHPGALGVLSDVLREASKRWQVIITTQSPDLIARFAADELRVVERVDGVTQIGSLDETQREVINEQLFSAGDLLRIEGLHRAPVVVAGGDNA